MCMFLLGLTIWRLYPELLLPYIWTVERIALGLLAYALWCAGEIDKMRELDGVRGGE